jgi:Bacterial Ig-like domain
MRRRYIQLILLLFAFLPLIFNHCARIEPPPGGPIDKTAPTILASVPSADSVNVTRGDRIAITFSENVDRASAQTAIFISPRPSGKMRYKWEGKILNLLLPETMADSTNYVVNIGSAVSDLRGNKMENSHVFAFSTGGPISRGEIDGFTYQQARPSAGMTVGLFDSASAGKIGITDSLYPPFLTQSGKNGEYALQYLPRGEYFAFAFDDRNKNQFFDYPQEAYGLPDRMIRIDTGFAPRDISFNLLKDDTSTVSIFSVSLTADHLLKVRLSRAIVAEMIRHNLDKIFLSPEDSPSKGINPAAVLEKETDTVSVLNFYFPALADGRYHISIEKEIVNQKRDSSSVIESAAFEIKTEPDNNRPVLTSVSHSGKIVFPADSVIGIRFSEPIDRLISTDSAISIRNSDSTLLSAKWSWLDDFRLNLQVSGMEWGKVYQMKINERLLFDMAGNPAGDSIKIYSFKTYSQDSLGSVSGTVAMNYDIDTVAIAYLRFKSVADNRVFIFAVMGKHIDIQLPSGKYILDGFIDSNANGRQDFGSLFPLKLAETGAVYPDTVRIRSRFESTGIEFIFK